MSSLVILNIASMTFFDFFGDLSCNSRPRAEGTICQEMPNLSLSQPHFPLSPPAESFSQSSSTSAWVLQSTKNEIAGENVKIGPPFKARNSCPSSSKATDMTDPLGPGPASP